MAQRQIIDSGTITLCAPSPDSALLQLAEAVRELHPQLPAHAIIEAGAHDGNLLALAPEPNTNTYTIPWVAWA
jgi:hypothetical protein